MDLQAPQRCAQHHSTVGLWTVAIPALTNWLPAACTDQPEGRCDAPGFVSLQLATTIVQGLCSPASGRWPWPQPLAFQAQMPIPFQWGDCRLAVLAGSVRDEASLGASASPMRLRRVLQAATQIGLRGFVVHCSVHGKPQASISTWVFDPSPSTPDTC